MSAVVWLPVTLVRGTFRVDTRADVRAVRSEVIRRVRSLVPGGRVRVPRDLLVLWRPIGDTFGRMASSAEDMAVHVRRGAVITIGANYGGPRSGADVVALMAGEYCRTAAEFTVAARKLVRRMAGK